MLFRSETLCSRVHRFRFDVQDYGEAIKRASATGGASAQAMIKQGVLLHRLRKGRVTSHLFHLSAVSPRTRKVTDVLGYLQYADEAQQLWQSALMACTPLTDVSLILQAHKLLHTPGAIAAALGAGDPQQSSAPPAAIPNGTAAVRFLTQVILLANSYSQHRTVLTCTCVNLWCAAPHAGCTCQTNRERHTGTPDQPSCQAISSQVRRLPCLHARPISCHQPSSHSNQCWHG